jgi:hypothetical protein
MEPSFKGRTWEDKLPQYLDILSNDAQIAPWQVVRRSRLYVSIFLIFMHSTKNRVKKLIPVHPVQVPTGLMVNRPWMISRSGCG